MKNLIITFAFITSLLLPGMALSGLATAADNVIPVCNSNNRSGTNASQTQVCKDYNAQGKNNNPVINIIRVAVEIVSYLAGAFAVVLIIISGIRFTTSGGDSNKVAQARGTLIYALVGVAIVALSRAIIELVINRVY